MDLCLRDNYWKVSNWIKMYGHTKKKYSILTSGRPTTWFWVFMQAYDLIAHMAIGEAPPSYRIKDPGTDGTAIK